MGFLLCYTSSYLNQQKSYAMPRKAASTPNWNFYLSKNTTTGIQYVQSSYNIWDPKKKQARIGEKAYVGRLFPDGSVRPSKRFLERFPEYAGKDLYYFQNRLCGREEYLRLNPEAERQWQELAAVKEPTAEEIKAQRQQEIEDDWRSNSRRCGLTAVAWNCLKDKDFFADLDAVFSNRNSQLLAALGVYMLDGGISMDSYCDWLGNVYIPDLQPVTGQRISELLKTIDQTALDKFFLRRHQRLLAEAKARREDNPKTYTPSLTLAFDSTSISTYSTTIEDAEYGHAKRDPELKQVNLALAVDQITGEIVYAYEYAGSINDKANFAEILNRMLAVGFDLSETLLVTDRGYKSMFNIQKQIDSGLKFIQCTPLNDSNVKNLFDRHFEQLRSSAFYAPDHRCYAVPIQREECEDWQKKIGDVGTENVRVRIHLYFDPAQAADETQRLLTKVDEVVVMKNNGQTVEPLIWKELRGCVHEVTNKEGKSIWVRKANAIDDRLKYAGCMALRTNVAEDPLSALKLYRERNAVECSYRIFKNQVGGDRMRATDIAYVGKLFLFTLATDLRTMLRKTAEQTAKETGMKIPGDSLSKVFEILNGVCMNRWGTSPNWHISTLTRKQRDCFALFGMKPISGIKRD